MADPTVQYSQNNTINAKVFVENIKDKIQNGASSVADALRNAGNKASASIKTAFEKKDLPKAPLAGSGGLNSPVEKKQKQKDSKFAGALVYPAELKYYTMFTFKAYKKAAPTEKTKDIPTAVVVLPMPANLSETFGIKYDTPELGPILGSLSGSALEGYRQMQAVAGEESARNKEFMSSLKAGAQVMGQRIAKAAGEQLDKATGDLGGGGIGKSFGASAALATGAAPNPHIAVLFQNVDIREHKFSYKFAPNSAAELKKLKEIIKTLKTRMLPGQSIGQDIMFTFPDVCDITFPKNIMSQLRIKRCVLTSLDVNYSPNGPAFFHTGDPVMVEISMSFKEMSVFTRDDIKD